MSVVRIEGCPFSINSEDREKLKEIWPVLGTNENYPTLKPVICHIDDLPQWIEEFIGNKVQIKPIKQLRFQHPDAPSLSKVGMPEVKEFVKTVNQIVMPGYELLQYGQIQVLTDACTDSVQSEMDEGWRIIAVMPQPGNRRPDYVMVRKGER